MSDDKNYQWTNLPGRPGESVGTVGEVATLLERDDPTATVAVEGRFVKSTRPSGDSGTWIAAPVTEVVDAERLANLERFAALVGPVITMTDILSMLRFGGRISADGRFEIVELADELGVGAP